MPLSVSYALNATACPAVRVSSTFNDPNAGDPTPAWVTALVNGDTTALVTKFNALAVREENLGLYSGGSYCIGQGCAISEGTGLQATIAAGILCPSGNLVAAQNQALTAAQNNYLWALKTGVLSSPVVGSTTPPAADAVYLGMETCNGSVVTVLDRSGVLENRFGMLFRRTADTGAPGDTPPASICLLTRTAGGVYLWDGGSHRLISDQLALAGGTLTGLLILAAAGLQFGANTGIIGGDYSGGVGRVTLQPISAQADKTPALRLLPRGTPIADAFGATNLGSLLELFATDLTADATNWMRAVLFAASDRWGLECDQGGTGTLQPFYLRQGSVDALSAGTSGDVGVPVSLTVGASGTLVKQIKCGTVTLDPASLAALTTRDDSVTITGVAVGDRVEFDIPSALEAGLVCGGCYVSGADTVKIRLYNGTAAPIDGASLSWSYTWWKLV